MTTWRHPHGEHVGQRWRDPKALANKDGWWPDRHDEIPADQQGGRRWRGARDNLSSDQKGQK